MSVLTWFGRGILARRKCVGVILTIRAWKEDCGRRNVGARVPLTVTLSDDKIFLSGNREPNSLEQIERFFPLHRLSSNNVHQQQWRQRQSQQEKDSPSIHRHVRCFGNTKGLHAATTETSCRIGQIIRHRPQQWPVDAKDSQTRQLATFIDEELRRGVQMTRVDTQATQPRKDDRCLCGLLARCWHVVADLEVCQGGKAWRDQSKEVVLEWTNIH